jgi:hypothetical protein
MKTSEARFEAKVELIPTAKLGGITGSYLPAYRLIPRYMQRMKNKIQM